MAIRHTSIPVRARNNAGVRGAVSFIPILGPAAVAIEKAIKTKKEKVVDAEKYVTKYKLNYSKCKKKVLDKGKTPYPDDPRTGIFVKNCHKDYKKWKEWEQKLGAAAASLEASLEAKGQLGEEAKRELKGAQRQAQVGAMTAEQKERFERKQRAKKITRLEKKGYESEFVPDEIPTDEVVEEEGMDSTTMTLLAVGGLAAVGGIYWFFIRKPEA